MYLRERILVESLAAVSALFEPMRDCKAPYWGPVWSLRQHYFRSGLPWRGGGEKAHERALGSCVRSGWVKRRKGGQKTVATKLSESGLAEAWKLIGVGSDVPLVVTREVARLGGVGWVAEVDFTGGVGWGDGRQSELKIIQDLHSPALVCGWLESNSDVKGRVAYRLTRRGLAAIRKADGEKAVEATELPEPKSDPDALSVFARAYMEAITWLNGSTAISTDTRGQIGECPLSMSIWDYESACQGDS